MSTYPIHTTGDWREGQIAIERVASSRAAVPSADEVIEETWRRAKIERPDVRLFDGPMCRLESFDARPDRLVLRVSDTSYKAFYGTNLMNARLADRFGENVLANPLGVSAIVLTSDNFLMLGRRNNSVAYYPNRLHPFAGALEPRGRVDAFEEVRRELREELSLQSDHIAGIRCMGIVQDRQIRHPEIVFAAQVEVPRERLWAQVDDQEHHESWSVAAASDAIGRALQSNEPFTPVARAALMLWSRAVG